MSAIGNALESIGRSLTKLVSPLAGSKVRPRTRKSRSAAAYMPVPSKTPAGSKTKSAAATKIQALARGAAARRLTRKLRANRSAERRRRAAAKPPRHPGPPRATKMLPPKEAEREARRAFQREHVDPYRKPVRPENKAYRLLSRKNREKVAAAAAARAASASATRRVSDAERILRMDTREFEDFLRNMTDSQMKQVITILADIKLSDGTPIKDITTLDDDTYDAYVGGLRGSDMRILTDASLKLELLGDIIGA